MRSTLVALSFLLACQPTGGDGAPEKPAPGETAGTKTGTQATQAGQAAEVPALFVKDDQGAVRAALQAAGVAFSDEDCVAWPASFPRVVLVGYFAHDRGCETAGMLVDRRWVAGGDAVAGLATRDFTSAKLEAKEAIARAWVDEAVHAFGNEFVTEAGAAFTLPGVPAFAPVAVRENKLGGVVVEGWEREPSGMNDESSFTQVTYRFAPDGKLSAEQKQQFTVDGPKLRGAEAAKVARENFAVDMTKFDLTCKKDADCTTVRASPCGRCGCDNTPLAARDRKVFQAAASAISCPPAPPTTGGAGCGGCPGHRGRCEQGTCVAKAE